MAVTVAQGRSAFLICIRVVHALVSSARLCFLVVRTECMQAVALYRFAWSVYAAESC